MLPEIETFQKWLRRKYPHSSTQIHYCNDRVLCFDWIKKPPAEIIVRDIDDFIEHSQQQHHAIATINRRLASLRTFFLFLAIEKEDASRNPVLPRRHFIRQGCRLPLAKTANPKPNRPFPIMDPVIWPFTAPLSPAESTNKAGIGSAAFPKETLRSPQSMARSGAQSALYRAGSIPPGAQ